MTTERTRAMKVLLIAYHFPPDRAVGALRAQKVAEAFRQRGHTVQVITARLPGERGRIREAAPGVTVRTVRPWLGPREFWAWLKKLRATSEAVTPAAGPSDPPPEPRQPGWKRLMLSLIWLPDDRQGFIAPALAAGLPRAWGGADLIYSTAPPFSGHLVGLLLHWFSRKRWVVEFRDPWTANAWKPSNSRTGFSDAVEKWLERRCLRAAYRVVSVSDGIKDVLKRDLPATETSKFMVVRNGIELLLPRPLTLAPGAALDIVYVGTFYFHRDPRPFLRALARVRHSAERDVRVSLVGQCRWFRGTSIEKEVEELGMTDIVGFRDWVARDECQAILEKAALLLLLAQKQPAQIPNKLYEYLGTRAPILAFADEDGESARMLEAVGGHVVIATDDQGKVEREVARALRLAGGPMVSGRDGILEQWTTKSQMERLVRALEPTMPSRELRNPAPLPRD